MAQSSSAQMSPELTLEFNRVFDAPRELVFRMFQDPEHLVRWYGPEGCALTANSMDFRVGGAWRRCMSSGPGHQHWISGIYTEIDPPSRLCFTYVNDYDSHEMLVEMDFVAVGNKTELRFRQAPFTTVQERDGHGWGWNSSFDLFADYLARVISAGGVVIGPPRADGVAADLIAAKERAREQQQQQQQQ